MTDKPTTRAERLAIRAECNDLWRLRKSTGEFAPVEGAAYAQSFADYIPAARGCRWPFGDMASGTFHYCGEPRDPGSPSYCARHRRIARRGPYAQHTSHLTQVNPSKEQT